MAWLRGRRASSVARQILVLQLLVVLIVVLSALALAYLDARADRGRDGAGDLVGVLPQALRPLRRAAALRLSQEDDRAAELAARVRTLAHVNTSIEGEGIGRSAVTWGGLRVYSALNPPRIDVGRFNHLCGGQRAPHQRTRPIPRSLKASRTQRPAQPLQH